MGHDDRADTTRSSFWSYRGPFSGRGEARPVRQNTARPGRSPSPVRTFSSPRSPNADAAFRRLQDVDVMRRKRAVGHPGVGRPVRRQTSLLRLCMEAHP